MSEPMPQTVGLCPNEGCRGEYYMPDAKAGDRCPMADCNKPLVIYSLPFLAYTTIYDEDAALRAAQAHPEEGEHGE